MNVEQILKAIQDMAGAAARWKLSWQQERRRNDQLEASVKRLRETILLETAAAQGAADGLPGAAVPQA